MSDNTSQNLSSNVVPIYKEVAVIRDPYEGVVAVITRRDTEDGTRHTFGFFKEFAKDNKTARSSYFGARHVAAIERLLPRVKEKMEEFRREEKVAAK